MHFFSILSVVLSVKDSKIRKAGEELVGRPWRTGPRISFHAGQYCDHRRGSHEPGSDRGGPGHMLDWGVQRGQSRGDPEYTGENPGGRGAALGHPAEAPASKPRKELDEIVAYDGWRSWPLGFPFLSRVTRFDFKEGWRPKIFRKKRRKNAYYRKWQKKRLDADNRYHTMYQIIFYNCFIYI